MTSNNQTIAGRLAAGELMVNNTLTNADILAALSRFGCDEAKLQTGQQLLDQVEALSSAQLVEYGAQFAATETLQQRWAEAKKTYIRTLKIARIALAGNPKAEAALLLRGRRKQSLAGWLDQATTFYTNLLNDSDLTHQMAGYGYDAARLEAEATLVEAVAEAQAAQKQKKGSARQATRRRDDKIAELDNWLAEFRAIARIALEEQPTALKKLGL